MSHLFDPFPIRSLTLSNRLIVSPMCQYSSVDGFSNEWHFVHLASRAAGGAALVFTEASAVSPEGRISPQDLGIWDDGHVAGLARIVRFIHSQRTLARIQIAHAGRKGSTARPWDGGRAVAKADGGWEPVGPANLAFSDTYPVPRALSAADIAAIVRQFRDAARRALEAGFDIVEVLRAHGYLIREILSPLVNTRTDEYGGSFDRRIRLCLEIVDAVRGGWPQRLPVFVRISTTDWKGGRGDLDQSPQFGRRLPAPGGDLLECSSGGTVHDGRVTLG